MKICEVYIEYGNINVDKPFTYICEGFIVERGMRVYVPFNNKDVVGFVYQVKEVDAFTLQTFDYEIKSICSVIDDRPLISDELYDLAFYMSKRYAAPFISCAQALLPTKLKPKSSKTNIVYETYVVFDKEVDLRGEKQVAALEYMKEHTMVLRSVFNKMYALQLKKLLETGACHLEDREKEANLLTIREDKEVILTPEQKDALSILQEKQGYGVYLLHGVTGSGKTEVFLQMAEATLKEGKQVLILVPEISLTPQMVSRVVSRFKENVAIYHSSLNNQEKYEQYKLVLDKKVQIVVGTRSSIFMPFENLGLIVLDEEHDASYKQDSTPRYHTRDIALYRASKHNCKVILASATPSLESYSRAIKKVYTLVEMKHRVNQGLPDIRLIDMKESMHNGESYILSNTLKEAIQDRLDKKEQVILLLNRRGYAPVLKCMDCGDVVMCPHCDLALNYHKATNVLKCHTCGYEEKNTYVCKKCGSTNRKYIGLGTQRLEEYIQMCFPEAAIVRMDADTTTRKGAHEKLLDAFSKKGDILIGTQMIAKGLDYENVTLVGILNGDALLNRSDYRSVELTFDLLVQASGRSGRGNKEGVVYIQVYEPDHYAITCSKEQDYKKFFVQEMKYRHIGNYPPYTYIASIMCIHKDLSVCLEESKWIKDCLDEEMVKILGPVELLKKNEMHRTRIVLKSKDEQLLSNCMARIFTIYKQRHGKCRLEMDLNPLNME